MAHQGYARPASNTETSEEAFLEALLLGGPPCADEVGSQAAGPAGADASLTSSSERFKRALGLLLPGTPAHWFCQGLGAVLEGDADGARAAIVGLRALLGEGHSVAWGQGSAGAGAAALAPGERETAQKWVKELHARLALACWDKKEYDQCIDTLVKEEGVLLEGPLPSEGACNLRLPRGDHRLLVSAVSPLDALPQSAQALASSSWDSPGEATGELVLGRQQLAEVGGEAVGVGRALLCPAPSRTTPRTCGQGGGGAKAARGAPELLGVVGSEWNRVEVVGQEEFVGRREPWLMAASSNSKLDLPADALVRTNASRTLDIDFRRKADFPTPLMHVVPASDCRPCSVEASPFRATAAAASKPNKCQVCRKKVGLTGFKCRCAGLFCGSHRYSDTHECSFDYKKAGREAIAKANPVVVADKIVRF